MNEIFKDEVSKELKSLRARTNYTQKEVANLANIDVMTVTRYENNSTPMQLDMIEKIINVYGVSLNIFFEHINANMHNN